MWSGDDLILDSRSSGKNGSHDENWWLFETVVVLHYHTDFIQVGDDLG